MRLDRLPGGHPVAAVDIVIFSLLLRLSTLFLLVLTALILPSWDTSAKPLLPPSSFVEGLTRWDTLHFLRIAERGGGGKHEVEKEWAFGRAIVEVLRVGERSLSGVWRVGDDGVQVRRERMVVGGSFMAVAASILSGIVLFQYVRFALTTASSLPHSSLTLACHL